MYLLSGGLAAVPDAPSQAEIPNFVKPLPRTLTPEDLAFLTQKRVFDVPNGDCRSEILRSYFLFVYPLLPLLDIEIFLNTILKNDPKDKISLLLFYAVMCSGAAHVDMQVLRASGFESRKVARKAFFERARVGDQC